jgi:hypothetical protein
MERARQTEWTSFLDGEVVLVSVHPLPGRDVG